MAQPKLTPGTLYIDREQDVLTKKWGEYIKIGIVRNERDVIERNKQHQTGNPKAIKAVYTAKSPMIENLESQIHYNFSMDRVLGEWFLMDNYKVNEIVIPIVKKIIIKQKESFNYFEAYETNKEKKSNGVIRSPSTYEKEIHRELIHVKERFVVIKAEQDIIKNRIIAFSLGFSGIEGIQEIQKRKKNASFEKTRLKKSYPEIYSKYEKKTGLRIQKRINIKGLKNLKEIDPDLYIQKKDSDFNTQHHINSYDIEKRPRNNNLVQLHENYLKNLKDFSNLQWEYTLLKTELLNSLSDDEEIKDIVSWKRNEVDAFRFDLENFKNDYPDLYKDYSLEESYYLAHVILNSRPYR